MASPFKLPETKTRSFSTRALNPSRSVGMKLFLIIIFCSILLCVAGGLLSSVISKGIIETKVSQAGLQTIQQTSGKLELLYGTFMQMTDQFSTYQVLQEQMDTLLIPRQSSYKVMQVYTTLTERLNTYVMNNPMITDSFLIPVNPTAEDSISATSSSIIGTSSILLSDVKAAPWYQPTLDAKGAPFWISEKPTTPESASNSSQAGPTVGIARVLASNDKQMDVFILLLEIRLSDIAA
ncbi:hypothetical protein [Paenibacillus glycinis]|uniref:Methyl-accepting chemotaxis protein n=1 Tax=Paenibacillus glycinis TaxID=2697035 RepID=A0ABW9XXB2_9BACL|nr:hypothetical protein [Paenibacillus glycinis]NBD27368.1 hypothetical protein [Paenibacillus glycinis]